MHHLLDCSNTTYYKKPHKVLKSSGYELHYNDTHHNHLLSERLQ